MGRGASPCAAPGGFLVVSGNEERIPVGRVAARFSHPGRELWLAAGGGSNPRVTMTTGGITRLLLSVSERERGYRSKDGGGTTTMRTTLLASDGGPVNGLPHTSIYIWPSKRYTRMYVHSHSRASIGTTTGGGGSINNSLAEPSISPHRYDEAVDRPRDYTRPRSWFFYLGKKILAAAFQGFLRNQTCRFVSTEI